MMLLHDSVGVISSIKAEGDNIFQLVNITKQEVLHFWGAMKQNIWLDHFVSSLLTLRKGFNAATLEVIKNSQVVQVVSVPCTDR